MSSSQSADRRSLLRHNVIPSHFDIKKIIPYLKKMGYKGSTKSMLNCGKETGYEIVGFFPEVRIVKLKQHCSLRICFDCSRVRKKRIREKYLHYVNKLEINRKKSLYFLTISPENYDKKFTFEKKIKGEVIVFNELGGGMEHIKKSFSKFRRLDYIKGKVLGGICTIESKKVYKGQPYYSKKGKLLGYHAKTGWNVHLHIIIYGGRLDNQIRGKCLDCKQNLMKYDKNLKSYYCASKKCRSYNVEVKNKDSKIVSLFKKCSKREVNIDIRYLSSNEHTLNYMLKYISASKEDFRHPKDLAQYLVAIWRKKTIIPFGKFVKDSPKRVKEKSDIEYINDPEMVRLVREELQKPNPPKNILNYYKEVIGR